VPSKEHEGTTFTHYTDPECHNTLRHRQTDRETDESITTIADRSADIIKQWPMPSYVRTILLKLTHTINSQTATFKECRVEWLENYPMQS